MRLCQPRPCAVDVEDFRIGFAVVDMASVLQWYDCSFWTVSVCFRCRAPCFPLFFVKKNNFGRAYVTSLNLAQHGIYSYGSKFFPLML